MSASYSLHDQLRIKVAGILEEVILSSMQLTLSKEEIYSMLSPPPNLEMGHLAFPCFILAKQAKKGPPQISQSLASSINASKLDTSLKKVEAQGPYLNFSFTPIFLGQEIVEKINSDQLFKKSLLNAPSHIMIEYSQPNTHKELHVGHMRNLCFGNALVRLFRFAGHKVTATTFPGDVGTHVAKCLWYLNNHNSEKPPKDSPGAWLGRLYSKGHNLLEDQLGSENETKNRQELTAILKELEAKKGPYYERWKETRQWSIDLMNKVYSWADVKFDRWYWESEMDTPSLEYAHELYKKGFLVESEGAIGMDLSEENLGFCLMIKSDGTGLYSTKDVMLARKKFEEFQPDLSLYVVDKRQALHFKQVFKVLEKIGFKEASRCVHLQYDFVELPDGAMSSRKGNIVPLMDLVEQMEKLIKNEYLNKYKDEWPEKEIEYTATLIANGAIKYGMIRMDNQRKIVFDMSEWLKLDGETGPYLQYVYARIKSMLTKYARSHQAINWSGLVLPEETALLIHLANFNTIVVDACKNFKTPLICSYLYDLGKLFNQFYACCPIGKCEDASLQQARLELSSAVATVMKQGLELLGIQCPERM